MLSELESGGLWCQSGGCKKAVKDFCCGRKMTLYPQLLVMTNVQAVLTWPRSTTTDIKSCYHQISVTRGLCKVGTAGVLQ